jgi:hypothetical protein
MTGGTIDLHDIATPKIFDPRQIEGLAASKKESSSATAREKKSRH